MFHYNSVMFSLFITAFLASSSARGAENIPPGCSTRYLDESRASSEIAPYAVRGRYCDGTIAILNSGELAVVSYTVGPVRFRPDQAELKIFGRARASAPIRLLGVDKREGGSYRLDGMIGSEGLTISLAQAIHPKKIDQDALGLFGWRDQQPQPVYVPVATKAAVGGAAATLTLRTPLPIIQADYQICPPSGQCGPRATFVKNQPGGSLLPMRIPADLPNGTHTIKLMILGHGDALFAQTILIEAPR